MLSIEQINILGDLLNTTFGRASTPRGDFPIGTAPLESVKGQLVGKTSNNLDKEGLPSKDAQLIFNFKTIVTFRSDQELQAEKKRFDQHARKCIQTCADRIKKEFKAKSGSTLKLKEIDNTSSIEIVYTGSPQLSFYTQRHRPDFHRAYHRVAIIFDIG